MCVCVFVCAWGGGEREGVRVHSTPLYHIGLNLSSVFLVSQSNTQSNQTMLWRFSSAKKLSSLLQKGTSISNFSLTISSYERF